MKSFKATYLPLLVLTGVLASQAPCNAGFLNGNSDTIPEQGGDKLVIINQLPFEIGYIAYYKSHGQFHPIEHRGTVGPKGAIEEILSPEGTIGGVDCPLKIDLGAQYSSSDLNNFKFDGVEKIRDFQYFRRNSNFDVYSLRVATRWDKIKSRWVIVFMPS